jgi:hypothetical protein
MYTGQQFRLKIETLAIEIVAGKRQAVHIPAGELVRILSSPRPDDQRMVDEFWSGRNMVLCTEDLEHRGEEVDGASWRIIMTIFGADPPLTVSTERRMPWAST